MLPQQGYYIDSGTQHLRTKGSRRRDAPRNAGVDIVLQAHHCERGAATHLG
jgi:hypothetical protein